MHDQNEVLLVAGTGGHGEQLKRLRAIIKNRPVSVLAENDLRWPYPDTVHTSDRVVDYHRFSRWRSFLAFVKTFKIARNVIANRKPGLIISTGPAIAVPVCLAARLMGVRVVHLESWSRIRTISNTTRLILRFRLADAVAYQYEDSILAGRKRCHYWGHL